MKIRVYKENLFRDVESSRIQEYLGSGWSKDEKAAEVITLKPATKAQAVKPEPGNDITKGE